MAAKHRHVTYGSRIYTKLIAAWMILIMAVSLTACCSGGAASGKDAKNARKQPIKPAAAGRDRTGTADEPFVGSRQGGYWPTHGWRTSAPEEQGMDSGLLLKAHKRIIKNIYPHFHSLLVVRHGYLVFEQYYNGFSKDSLNGLQSGTKSVISALIGIAIKKGYIQGTDQKLEEFFPEYYTGSIDPAKRDIRLKHLLTMSAGLEWEHTGDIRHRWEASGDKMKFAIQVPKVVAKPGETFKYNCSLSHLMSGIITKKAGVSTLEFADRYLFGPLGIRKTAWLKDRNGYYLGDWGLDMLPRDMAKIGYLYLHKGSWDGRQILDPEWVRESTAKHMDGSMETFGYGYQWWTNKIGGHSFYMAWGTGGQNIFVFPDLDMVVVTTQEWLDFSSNQQVADQQQAPFELLGYYIVKAAE